LTSIGLSEPLAALYHTTPLTRAELDAGYRRRPSLASPDGRTAAAFG
jgi:hypothetical protein